MADPVSIVTLTDPTSAASEAYRTLRMNLQFASLDRQMRTLLVTSPGASEGKTTTLANLAVTMAQIDQRVIMVDCDLRRPGLHLLFGIDNERGLTNMVLDDDALAHPPLQATAVPGLSLLASGALPPRPSDLLGSKRMEAVLARLLELADLVLLDAAPVMTVTDAVMLATKVDEVLLVTSAGVTKREQAQAAIERLKKVNAHIIGTALTNAAVQSTLHSY